MTTPALPSLLLRRLACPTLPWQPRMASDSPQTPYNPYITVDYVANIPLNHGASNNGIGLFGTPRPLAKRYSQGRVQPYNGHPQYNLQQAPNPALVNQPQHTFFAHNQDNVHDPRPPFDWLVHLDRQVISPMELIHAASCRPHQVTHLFKNTLNDTYTPFNHAPVLKALRRTRIAVHRALDFWRHGLPKRGARQDSEQIPGKINLNTIWDPEIFFALCDPQTSNYFDAKDVAQIYQWMLANRTPGGTPGPNDRPFKALASANFLPSGNPHADGNGINDTLLRRPNASASTTRCSGPAPLDLIKQPHGRRCIPGHPYRQP